jgi:hypothetical protein
MRIRDPGWKKSDPGSRMGKIGSGINIPDLQHCYKRLLHSIFIKQQYLVHLCALSRILAVWRPCPPPPGGRGQGPAGECGAASCPPPAVQRRDLQGTGTAATTPPPPSFGQPEPKNDYKITSMMQCCALAVPVLA